jgi:hypothetical protein
MLRTIIAGAAIALLAAAAWASGTAPDGPAAKTVDAAPVSAEHLFQQECGACHMAFPPEFLPTRSWRAIMDGLPRHFGENAALAPDETQKIGDYLAANAADANGRGSPVLRGLRAVDVPLRITETPFWIGRHDEVSSAQFERASIKSKSNCLACHTGPSGATSGDD